MPPDLSEITYQFSLTFECWYGGEYHPAGPTVTVACWEHSQMFYQPVYHVVVVGRSDKACPFCRLQAESGRKPHYSYSERQLDFLEAI